MKIKIIILLCALLIMGSCSYAQERQKTQLYTGLGTSLIIFTHPDVSSNYPVFNFRSSSFMTEFNPFIGLKISKHLGVELSPSFLIANSSDNKGFYFTRNNQTYFYLPSQTNLFMMPINAKLKYYPFGSNRSHILQSIYFSLGGGVVYTYEEFNNFIYLDNLLNSFQRSEVSTNKFWSGNYQVSIGFQTKSQFGYGLEVLYRIIPLFPKYDLPVTTDRVSNFSSVNLTVKFIYSW